MAVLGCLFRNGDLHRRRAGRPRAGPAAVDDPHGQLPSRRAATSYAAPHETDGRQVVVVLTEKGRDDAPGRPRPPRRLAGPPPARAHPRRARHPPPGRAAPGASRHHRLTTTAPPLKADLEPHLPRPPQPQLPAATPPAASCPTPAPGCSASRRTGWSLRAHRRQRHRPRHHHRPAVPAGPAALAVRRRDRRPLPQAAAAPAHPARHGRSPSLVLGVLAVAGVAEVWHVYVLAFLFGIGSAFDAPARQSFVSEMVGPDDLTNAVGLNSATFNTARIIGPARRRPDDRRPRRRRLGDRLGDPDQRAVVRRGDLAAASTWTPRCCNSPKPVARTPGDAARGRPLRPQPAEDDG